MLKIIEQTLNHELICCIGFIDISGRCYHTYCILNLMELFDLKRLAIPFFSSQGKKGFVIIVLLPHLHLGSIIKQNQTDPKPKNKNIIKQKQEHSIFSWVQTELT